MPGTGGVEAGAAGAAAAETAGSVGRGRGAWMLMGTLHAPRNPVAPGLNAGHDKGAMLPPARAAGLTAFPGGGRRRLW